MPADLIPRRTLLEGAIRLAAMPAGVNFFSAWMEAAQEHDHTRGSSPPQLNLFNDYRPQFFSAADFEALQSFTELLIPTDETPGAREAHCSEFIDFLLQSMTDYSPETQNQWRSALHALKEAGFHSADGEGRAVLLNEIAKPESDPAAHHPAYPAYRLIKRESTFAFYTARAGMIDDLDYRGNSYNAEFPACNHPEHHEV